jgi:glutathione S-transferase
MKLYFMPGACSLAAHISLREAELPFSLVRYDKETHVLDSGQRLDDVNEKGYVPVLELDNGARLTEVPAVLQYIADQRPASGLAPPPGTWERYKLQEWLNFLSSEVHKSFWAFFHGGCDAERPNQTERLLQRFGWMERKIGSKAFLMSDAFTVADAFLLTMLNWLRPAGFDLGQWPQLKGYRSRVSQRPSVQAALEAEGLKKRA